MAEIGNKTKETFELEGKDALIIAEAMPVQFTSAISGKAYWKWNVPTNLKNFSVMEEQLRFLWVDKDFTHDTKKWIGKRVKIEVETNAKGFKQYVFLVNPAVTEEIVK